MNPRPQVERSPFFSQISRAALTLTLIAAILGSVVPPTPPAHARQEDPTQVRALAADPSSSPAPMPPTSEDAPAPLELTFVDELPPATASTAGDSLWTIETVDGDPWVGSFGSLATGDDGSLHVSYYDEPNADLRYAVNQGSTWLTATVDSLGDVGQYTSLALDASGNPRISYREYTHGMGELRYARIGDTGWVTETVHVWDDAGDAGSYSSLAIDAAENPHIAYLDIDVSGDEGLGYAYNDGVWNYDTPDEFGVDGYISLALADDLYPRISYYNRGNGELCYASLQGTSWLTETVDSVGDVGDGGVPNSLALDAGDQPHISYYARNNRELVYAHLEGVTWISETIAVLGEWQVHTSLALDASGRPHIAYFDDWTYNLVYATLDGTEWITQTVDSSGDVDGYPSLAFDADGQAHIAYYAGSGGLKHAWQQICTPAEVLDVNGPLTMTLGTSRTFTATVSPATATVPLEFVWQLAGWSQPDDETTSTESVLSVPATITGTYPLTVTVSGCGGVLETAREVTIVKAPLPDLVVTDLWQEGDTIWYQIANRGQATASEGHRSLLTVDGLEVIDDGIKIELAPGETMNRSFEHTYDCTDNEDTLLIDVDAYGWFDEEDETNNAREESWFCDLEAPVISGVEVNTTTDTATIVWTTDEPSDGAVQYGTLAGQYDGFEYDDVYLIEHEILLSDLTPSTSYHFLLRATDSNGMQSYSDEYYFETQALVVDPPEPTSVLTQSWQMADVYTIQATYADTSNIEGVQFYLDGVLIDADYAASGSEYEGIIAPYALGMSRQEFYGTAHTLETRTRSLSSGLHISEEVLEFVHESPETEVEISFPPPDLTIYIDGDSVPAERAVDFIVFAAEYDYQCDWIPVSGSRILKPDCEDVQQAVDYVHFLVDNHVVDTSYPSSDGDLWHHYTLELGGFTGTERTVVARAVDTSGVKHDAQATIHIQKIVREPILDVIREVTRTGNFLQVQLTVENLPEATGDAMVDTVYDNVAGFQIVPKETTRYRVTSAYAYVPPWTRDANVKIDLGVLPADTVTLAPGESIVLEYLMVPVLYEEPFDFRIGGLGRGDVRVYYEEPSGDVEMRGFDRRFEFTLQHMVADAIAEADYLLVTHPRNLAVHYGPADLDPLLGTMAELASLKQGVLGYLETQSAPDVYGALVEPGGGWAARLHPDFSTEGGGYMLIVGEPEIVPSWHITGFGGDKEVRLSDQLYSSVGNGKPLINLGRVIGDSMVQLRDNIQTSINVYQGVAGYGFDRSRALLASGVGNMRDIMVTEVNYAENTLQNQGLDVTKLHWKDYATLDSFFQFYDKADELAAGDVLVGDGTDEIVLANESGDYIVIMDGSGALLSWFSCSIEEGDALAVGDVDGDGTDEIVFGDCSSDQIHIYEVSGLEVASFAQTFSPDDRLAVGDVTPEAGEEIVMADQDDHIYVFDGDGNELKDFVWAFGVHDALTVGDVNGDNVDEVVLRTETAINESEQITATFSSYLAAGATLSQTHSFERTKVREGDALATGDVNGDGTDEILIGLTNHYLGIKDQRGGNVRWGIPTELMPFDGVTAGRFSGGLVDEILIADQDDVYYYPDLLFLDQGYEAYRDAAPDQDVLFFIGHGTPDSWGPGLRTSGLPDYVTINPQFPLDFGDINPVVYGASCQTGDYQSNDDANIAEAFLDSGAAVYIGAVENSMSGTTERSLEWFLDNWEDGEAVGEAWFDMERAKWQLVDHGGDGWDFLLHEYNLYGDPKFGAQPDAADVRGASPREAQPPPAEIAFELPEVYVETGADGYDRVSIPGGQLVVDVGEYRIPYWTHTVEITRGYRIQDLSLVKRSEALLSENLNLPVTPDEIWSRASGTRAADDIPVLDPDDSWVPALDQGFTWQVVDNPDGTTTLILKVYPFHYQPLTGNARYHRGYDFQVISMTTTVAVDQLTTSQMAYPEGDAVPIELIVENTGNLQDVLVDATIRRNPGGELVEGLLLRTLHDLGGLASFSMEWDSAGAPSGEYYVEVKLYDSDSNLLDQDTRSFRIGVVSGEIGSLEATPELFEVGETVDISMVFDNVGTLPITGTAVIEVQTAEGFTFAGPFTDTVEGLAPGSSVELQRVWGTTGVALGDYRVIGYVLYDARSTGASTVALTNLRRVYLPVVLRDF